MILEILTIGIVIGFVLGHLANNWIWTKKVADALDKILKRDK